VVIKIFRKYDHIRKLNFQVTIKTKSIRNFLKIFVKSCIFAVNLFTFSKKLQLFENKIFSGTWKIFFRNFD